MLRLQEFLDRWHMKREENSEHVVFNNEVYRVMCVITRTTYYGIN